MKVLVLSWGFPNQQRPVHGVFVRERIKALAHHSEVRVVAPVKWFPFGHLLAATTRSRVARRETQDGLEVFHPRYFTFPSVLRSLDGFLYFLSVLRIVRKVRRDFPFDLIDAHFAYPDGFAAVLLGKFFGTPVVITLRGTIQVHCRYRVRRALVLYCLRRANNILSVSAWLKAQAVSLGIPPQKIQVARNGVDIDRFRPLPMAEARTKLGLPPDRRILVSVAHLVELKGFHRVIDLLPSLLGEFPDLLYVIVGGPTYGASYLRRLRKLIASRDLGDHVLLAGRQMHERIPLWLNAGDVFCLATRTESFGNVFLEAMACGKPVVATRAGAIPEVVDSDDVGILVERDDTNGMIAALAEALRRDWDSALIRRHAELQTWDHVAERVLGFWVDALRNGPAS
jgi:teichuronic acid biosynthesis glycosyltransferase TuaC